MAKNTQRDRVWIAALRDDEFTKHDIIDSVDAGSRTVHDVLKTMVDADLLTETNDRRRVDRGDSYMYTDVTVYTSDDADESDSSTTDAPEPDMSDIDNGEINRLKEEIGVSNGDVPVQPHGSDEDNAGSAGSQLPEIPDSPFNRFAAGANVLAKNLDGVGEDKAKSLVGGGYDTVNDLYQASHDDLTDVTGIGDVLAEQICWQVASYVRGEYDISEDQMADATVSDIADIFNVSHDMAKKWESNAEV